MKKNWTIGFLGIAIILFSYIGFPYAVKSAIMIALGLTVSFIAFRSLVKDKIALRMRKNDDTKKTEEIAN